MTAMSTVIPPRLRRVFAVSLGATFAVFAVLAVFLIVGASNAEAATCTLTTTQPAMNWTDTTKWATCGGSYPGANAGDTAVIGFSSSNLTVDTVISNGVILQIPAGNITVNIPAGNALKIEPSSSSTSSNTINVNGGQLGVGTGTVTWGGNLNHNTGTIALTGTLENVSGQGTFTVNGGTIQGPGTFKIVSGSGVSFTGSGGGMTVNGAFVEVFGVLTYSSNTVQSLSLNNGAHIKVQSGGQLSITGGDAIQYNGVGGSAIDIFSGGALSKGTSVTNTQIDAAVNNGGSVTVTSGQLHLYGGGTHTGAFSTATGGTTMAFDGTHDLAAGTTAAGAGVFFLVGGNFNVNTTSGAPWAPQFFTHGGGTLGGTGTIRVTNTFNWMGGTHSSAGTTELQGTTNVLSGSVALDFGRIMANSGTFNYGPNGADFLSIDNGARINNTGTFNLLNDRPITSFTPASSYIENSSTATFNKTGGTISQISAGFDLLGQSMLVPGSGMTIQLLGGSSTSGKFGGTGATINLSALSSTLDLAGSGVFYKFDATATGLTVTGSGILRLSSGAGLAITGGPISVTNFVQDDTSLLKSSAAGISVPALGSYTWNGGTIDGLGGNGNLITVNGSATLKLKGTSGAMTLTNFGFIRNNGGAIDFNPVANLSVNNGARINNNSGTFTFNNNNGFGILTDNVNGPLFFNSGTVVKAANPNTVQVDVAFNHNTTLTVSGGTLRLNGGGTSGGSMTITNAADRIEIGSGNYFTTIGAVVGGAGTFAVMSGATLSTNAAFSVPRFELNAGGTVDGGGSLTVNNAFKWTGGTFTGTGSATISSGVITDATALTGPPTIANGFTFTNNGPFNYNPTFNLTFSGTPAATFDNGSLGTFDIQGNGTTAVTGTHAFNNAGTVKKTAGAGGFSFTAQFSNIGGVVDQQFGSNSTIAFNGAGSVMTGGTIQSSNAAGAIDFLNPPGSFSVNGGSFAGPGAINLKGGLLIVNSAQNFPPIFNLQGGQLSANNLINIPSGAAFNWNGGSISGSTGQVTVKSGGTMTIDTAANTLSMNLVPLVIDPGGNVNWNSGSNSLTFHPGASVTDNGTFTVSTNSTLSGTAPFSVSGVFQHTVPGTLNVSLPLNVQSGGTITSSGAGTIAFVGTSGVSHAGTFDAQTGSFIEFGGGTHQFNAGAGFSTGTGTYKLNAGTVNLLTNVSAPNFGIIGGSLVGSGNLDTTTNFSWSGGAMAGTGTTTVASGAASFTGGPLDLNRNLTLNGNTTMNAPGGFNVQTTATVTNNATFNAVAGNVNCVACTTASFVNNGTLQKSAGSPVTWALPVSGSGTLNVTGSTFADTASSSFTSASISNPGVASFSGTTVTIGSVTGGGTLAVTGGSTTVSGSTTLTGGFSALSVLGGTATLNGTSTADILTVNGGTLTGSGNLTIGGVIGSSWTAGTITGAGNLTMNAPMLISGSAGAMSLGRNLINNASMTYAPPNATQVLTVNAPASITNNSAFNITGGFDLAATGAPVFTNAGGATFNRTLGSTNAINFGPAFSNAGTANFSLGTTTFTNGYAQTAGNTNLNGATIGAPAFNFTGGVFSAKGNVNGSVTINGATLNPGTSPGAVTITGNYTQSSTGVMNVELNGTTAGTTYDQVNVTGNASLDGTLNATVGYSPANNDQFDVLTIGGTRTGDFATKNLPAIPGPGTLSAAYIAGSPEALRITALIPNADLSLSVTAPASAPHNSTISVSYTVTNLGASPANTVVFNGTLANGSLTSIVSSGPCTTSPISCNLGTLAGGGSANIIMTISATTVGTLTTTGNVTTSTTDPTPGNDSAASATAVSTASDFGILSVSAPSSVPAGSSMTALVTVKNSGPDTSAPTLNLSITGGTIDAVSGGFTCVIAGGGGSATCSGPSMAVNAIATLGVDITAQLSPGSVVLTATVSSPVDPSSANDTGSSTTVINTGADVSVSKSGPATANLGATVVYTITVNNAGPVAANDVTLDDPTPSRLTRVSVTGACTTFPCSLGTLAAGQSVVVTATYTINPGPPGLLTNSASVTTSSFDPDNSNDSSAATTAVGCGGSGPTTVSPAANATVGSPATFTWNAVPAAVNYTVNVNIGGTLLTLGPTTATSISSVLPDGSGFWNVTVNFGGNCTAVPSANVPFTVCSGNATPLLRLVSEAVSGQQYKLEWDAVPGATGYEVDESNSPTFASVTTTTLTGTSVTFQHTATSATPFYYRARAVLPCAGKLGPSSIAARVVIVPPPSPNDANPNVNVPAGSNTKVVQIVHVPGVPGGTFPFVATTDQPWLTVAPASGNLPPQGLDFTVSADPTNLTNGTFTGTILVTLVTPTTSNKVKTAGITTVKAPVSISLVTPVSSTPKTATPSNAMIIPSVGHLNGINSVWRSDIRLANTGFTKTKYQLTFTPSGEDASKPVKTTTIDVDAGGTTALDNIVRNWYGVGSLGEAANGVLEIRPLNTANKGGVEPQVDVAFATVVSSRTYNVSAQGTLGQFIPAVPFAAFVGKAATNGLPAVLGLQQIAQNDAFRTNLGIVEAGGKPATVLVNVFDGAGKNVFSQSYDFAAGEQKQFNSFLAANNITLADGRIEVQVTGGDGRITAYASRIDNATGDPLLVTGTPLTAPGSTRYVVPGVAALNTGFANWQSDVRLFNPGTSPVTTTMTYYPQNNSGNPSSTSVTLNAGETKQFDNILQNLFGLNGTGGALHVDTPVATSFLVSGRTFNQTSNGTFGQYIPAVTPAQAVGAGGNTLQILQAEESVRYRTNVGIAEVDGKPAEVELMIFIPGSKTAARTTFTLGANEFRQYNVFQDSGMENVYNARVQLRVLSGNGKITAYGSVVDMLTQDPTYIPAQQAQ
jgi:fibronectin-binding autotransporter adhesin